MVDLLVVGGGILGSWVALRAARKGLTVAVADQSDNPGDATSGRNSGVLHAGIYYKPGSLKAVHCIRGHQLTREFLDQHNLPHSICGKIITSGSNSEGASERVQSLFANAQSLGARGLEIVQNPGKRYTGVIGKIAIHSPYTGVCDAAAYLRAVQHLAREEGVIWLTGRKMEGFDQNDGVLLSDGHGKKEQVVAEAYVNSAGLYSDSVAKLTGATEFEIIPVRGEYYRLKKAHSVNLLVYPLPDPDSTALGVHYTFHPGGDAYAGPNAISAEHKEDYRIEQSASDFAASLGRILEGYTEFDLTPGYAGLRPRLRVKGEDYRDFFLERRGSWVHLLGIESPGLTSAASLSETVVELL